jgi:hypothetical protein
VLTQPRHALGPAVWVGGDMGATPGVQADITLSVRDAESDEVVANPHHRHAMMFTDLLLKHIGGPVDLQAPRGRRDVFAQSWEYTGRPLLLGGTIRGPQFDW